MVGGYRGRKEGQGDLLCFPCMPRAGRFSCLFSTVPEWVFAPEICSWAKSRSHSWDSLSHTHLCLTTGMYLGADTLGCPNAYCRRQHSETASLNTYWSESAANQEKLFSLTNELTLWHWSICGDHTGVKVWERYCCSGTAPSRSRVHTL